LQEASCFFVYIDTAGKYNRLRYEVQARRWHVENIFNGSNQYRIDAAYTEPDTGRLLFAVAPEVTP